MTLTVPQAAVRHKRTEQHIRKLLGAQVIKGEKLGRDWLVNERSAAAYFAQERRPGRKKRRLD